MAFFLCFRSQGIDPEKIAIGGFSAGGITTSLTSAHADDGDPNAEDPMLRVSSRPNAALLLYGAFSNVDKLWSVGGYNIEAQRRLAMLDPIANIGPMMPPTFIFQTHGDDPRIGLSFAMELARRGVPFEIHTFEEGGHGGALFDGKDCEAPDIPHTAKWADLAADWLRMRGFMQ